jgi:hypothetical protein
MQIQYKKFPADAVPIGKIMCIRSDNGGEFVGQNSSP